MLAETPPHRALPLSSFFRYVKALSINFEAPRDVLPIEPEVLQLIGMTPVAVLRVRGEEVTHGLFLFGVVFGGLLAFVLLAFD